MTTLTLEVDIQAALLMRLCPNPAVATSDITTPATPVALPLIAYEPTTGKKYLDAHALMRAEPDHPGLSFQSSVIHRGIFQVDAVIPNNTGEAPGLRLAALVGARFAIGTRIAVGAYTLVIDKEPAIAAAVLDAPWVRFPVSIRYCVVTS